MNAMTDLELIARQHIAERAAQMRATSRLPRAVRQRRRVRLAGTLRRVADRLDG